MPSGTILENDLNLCDVCKKSFASATQLSAHLKVHNIESYICECGDSFPRVEYLRSHQKTHNKPRQEGKFSCNHCEKKLASTTSLKYHLLCHSDSKQVLCKLCDRAFRTEAMLKSHMKTHTKEKPYKCSYCDKAFAHIYQFNEKSQKYA